MNTLFTARQDREREEFNRRAAWLSKSDVDFEYYTQKQFGPWNPYWRVHDYARCTYPPPDSKLLSYGCGTGKSALVYAKMGYAVCGFDISEALVETARCRADKYELTD